VNFFQPSFKLKSKTREGSKIIKRYHAPATPCEQLLADKQVGTVVKEQLRQQFAALDPVQLLNQLRQAQHEIARLESGVSAEQPTQAGVQLDQFVQSLATAWRFGEVRAPYKKRRADAKPHTWRTRPDPFEDVWPMLQQWLDDAPHTTANGLFRRLNAELPNRFKPGQYRTLQRRVKEWRTAVARRLVLGFNDNVRLQLLPFEINVQEAPEEKVAF